MAAPKGNKNAAKGFPATKALKKALELRAEGVDIDQAVMTDCYKTLVQIWDVQITKALDNDNQSAQMIIDRLEGKASQKVDIEADITTRNAKELTEDELIAIASRSSE